jgi:hypothetical protein
VSWGCNEEEEEENEDLVYQGERKEKESMVRNLIDHRGVYKLVRSSNMWWVER